MAEGEWVPMPGYPVPFNGPITQRKWAECLLPVGEGLRVLSVAATNEVLRHAKIGHVWFKAQNHSA